MSWNFKGIALDKTEIDEHITASIKNFSLYAKGEISRDRPAIEVSDFVQKKAGLISAHFLLHEGARILDMGCGTGEVTYALALLNPQQTIIGIDRDRDAIEMARRLFRLPNLTFMHADIGVMDIEDESIDGIINSNVLHHVYSTGGYDEDAVVRLLEAQIKKLKVGGTMLIRDYMLPSENEYVQLELTSSTSQGNTPELMSDADLLIQFSQTARPMVHGCEGFYIEEMPARREGSRLFRLQHKWALEFIHRKDSRRRWEKELRKEYTFFTYNDFRRELGRLGMRMAYSAPYWNPWVVKNSFMGRIQLYQENGSPLSPPPTNYFIISQKVADLQSLALEERRPSQKTAENLKVMVVRDKKTGLIQELVKRPGEYCDIIPYRITPDNRIVMYLRGGYPRPIVNAVLRGSANIDGKKWSGHLVEPITMETSSMTENVDDNRRQIFSYMSGYTGLRPKRDDSWHVGDTYFPAPDRIDEAIEPVFIEVENPQKHVWPIDQNQEKDVGFTEVGSIVEIDGASIMSAAQVGLLPDPRLELYVMDLMMRYDIAMPQWLGDTMPEIPLQKVKVHEPEDLLKEVEKPDFEEDKNAPKTLKAVRSVFVEEGKSGRTSRALSAQDIEFIVPDDGIENVAVVMPLSRGWDNTLLVAMDPGMMSVPNRLGGEGTMFTAPSFPLPRDVRTIDDVKSFVADKFRIPVAHVAPLGESYFVHTSISAQRIYPFVITAPGKAGEWQPRYMRIKKLWRFTVMSRYFVNSAQLRLLARTQMMMGADHDMSMRRSLDNRKTKGFQLERAKDMLDDKGAGYSTFPSRILGQRGAASAAPVDTHGIQFGKPGEREQSESRTAELAARIGKRLVDSYAQAKKLIKGDEVPEIKVKQTPTIDAVDKDIDSVGDQLKTLRAVKPEFKLELTPPEPKKRR